MIPPYPPEPRYGDAWKNLKAAMCEEDSLWEFYQEDTENGLEWEEFVIANAIGYLEDLINSEGEY